MISTLQSCLSTRKLIAMNFLHPIAALVFFTFCFFFARDIRAQTTPTSLTAEQAQHDVHIAIRALKELHPALTKYRTAAEIDAAFARFEARGNGARNATEMYLAATELAASIRCGHTWTNTWNQSEAVKSSLLEAKNKLPLLLAMVESRFLVLASADASVNTGDEVLAINDQPTGEIASMMLPYLRADGSSDGKRRTQLNHNRIDPSMMDVIWPLVSPPQNGVYALKLKAGAGELRVARVSATTLTERSAALQALGVQARSSASDASPQWKLEMAADIATMTLPTFAFWQTKFDYNAWLEDAFARLTRERVRHLIVDIRAAEGGDDGVKFALLRHLIAARLLPPTHRTFSAYERVPYPLAKHLDTWNYDFFDRTGKVTKTGDRQFALTSFTGSERAIEPAGNRFSGKIYLLISAENSSAAFHVAWLAKLTQAITLIGERTGGNLRGLNSGQLAWVTLPNSRVAIDIPLLSAVPIAAQPDASIEPDVEVKPTFAARREGRDEVMEAALRLIRNR
jgi:hypothetical protein